MNILFKISALFVLCLFFTGCGRKQKNIFHFPSEEENLKINKLYFPAVGGLKVKRTPQGNLLSWIAVKCPKELEIEGNRRVGVEFMGYNVYRLVNELFVSKKTVNEFFIKETKFLDNKILEKNLVEQKHSYIVCPVFSVHDRILQGPSSQVVRESTCVV
jgi:hypothetical protein